MFPVTKPFLPPQEEYERMLKGVWDRNWLTNDGPLVQELERNLKSYLGLENLLYLSNGTIALQIAIKALELKGEVITTPFSYVATSSSLVWEGCTPVFADIDPKTLTIDPEQVAGLISPRTTGILATHVYGNPCHIDQLERIATSHGLKVIYDGAHAFGTRYKGRSVLEFGDVTTLSFHATKLFHTVEGGAVTARADELNRKMSFMRNFGHDGPGRFAEVGINGKNSEFHAAMGLVNLRYVEEILKSRRNQSMQYDRLLSRQGWTRPQCVEGGESNYSYYAIVLPTEEDTVALERRLNQENIFPRRYFYPGLNELRYVNRRDLPVSDSISRRVLCLPLYYSLTEEEIERICAVILQ